MIRFMFTVFLALAPAASASTCQTTVYSAPLPNGNTGFGDYQRVHPSGKYMLFSDRSAKILDLTDLEHPVVTETAARNEAYPVEPDWRLIASPGHTPEGMKYFYFDHPEKGLLQKGNAALEAFSDEKHPNYYHSVGAYEVTQKSLKFRTAMSGMDTREYSVKFDDAGNVAEHTRGEIYSLCANLTKNENADEEEVARLKKRSSDLRASYRAAERRFKFWRIPGTTLSLNFVDWHGMAAMEGEIREVEDKLRAFAPFNVSTPVISKDGNYVMAAYKGATHIMKILDHKGTCEDVKTIPYTAGKGSFAYPIDGENRYVAFQASSSILPQAERPPGGVRNLAFVYDLKTEKLTPVVTDPNVTVAGYPGFTKDNKLMYPVTVKKPFSLSDKDVDRKIAISDPFGTGVCGDSAAPAATGTAEHAE